MDAPISFAKPHVTSWIVEDSGYTGQKAEVCSSCADLAYDWMAMRADQLGPEDAEQSKAMCADYVTMIMRRRAVGMDPITAMVLLWVLQAIVHFVILKLLDWIFSKREHLTGWKQFVATQNLTQPESE